MKMKFLKKNTNKTVDLKIAVNFAYNTAYQILTILIPLLTTPYLSTSPPTANVVPPLPPT